MTPVLLDDLTNAYRRLFRQVNGWGKDEGSMPLVVARAMDTVAAHFAVLPETVALADAMGELFPDEEGETASMIATTIALREAFTGRDSSDPDYEPWLKLFAGLVEIMPGLPEDEDDEPSMRMDARA